MSIQVSSTTTVARKRRTSSEVWDDLSIYWTLLQPCFWFEVYQTLIALTTGLLLGLVLDLLQLHAPFYGWSETWTQAVEGRGRVVAQLLINRSSLLLSPASTHIKPRRWLLQQDPFGWSPPSPLFGPIISRLRFWSSFYSVPSNNHKQIRESSGLESITRSRSLNLWLALRTARCLHLPPPSSTNPNPDHPSDRSRGNWSPHPRSFPELSIRPLPTWWMGWSSILDPTWREEYA